MDVIIKGSLGSACIQVCYCHYWLEVLVIPFFWDAAVVNLVEIYEHCNGAYCLLVQCRLNITLP